MRDRNKQQYETAYPDRYGLLKGFAKENRCNPTVAETCLWSHLRANQLGVYFRRQHPIGDYIADFVCIRHMLIVEVDGGYHNKSEQQEEDMIRMHHLQALGYRILRFSNEEVMFDTDNTINKIVKFLSADGNHPFPLGGEGDH